MGNAVQKMKVTPDQEHGHQMSPTFLNMADRGRAQEGRKSSTGSSEVSWTSAHEYHEDDLALDSEASYDESLTPTTSDEFMKAVLSFCSYMDGRMDSLDNSKLYEEFCNYTATHTARIGVA